MIFDITTIGNSSGGLPEYVWLEYYRPSEMLTIGSQSPADTDHTQVDILRASGQTEFYLYSNLKINDSYTNRIEGYGWHGVPLPDSWTSVVGYYEVEYNKWVGGISICKTTNFNTGHEYVSLRYTYIYYTYSTKQNSIKTIHLTEHTGSQYAKVPIVSLMGGVSKVRARSYWVYNREVA